MYYDIGQFMKKKSKCYLSTKFLTTVWQDSYFCLLFVRSDIELRVSKQINIMLLRDVQYCQRDMFSITYFKLWQVKLTFKLNLCLSWHLIIKCEFKLLTGQACSEVHGSDMHVYYLDIDRLHIATIFLFFDIKWHAC